MEDNSDLSCLFNKYGSDKDRNGYAPLYHTLFYHQRQGPLNVLEIGIGTMLPGVRSSMIGYALEHYSPGGSLRAWRDYFPQGRVIGMDIQPDTQITEDRIETYLCDSTNAQAVTEIMERLNVNFDIIIDDGCHHFQSQFKTLTNFYPYLKSGGIYVIEDIYPGSMVSENPAIVKNIVNNDPLFFVGLHNNQCVIYKNHLTSPF
jgi:hypothetical protein